MGGDADGLRKVREARARELERERLKDALAGERVADGLGDLAESAGDIRRETALDVAEKIFFEGKGVPPFTRDSAMAAAREAAEQSLKHASQAEFDAERAAPKGRKNVATGRASMTVYVDEREHEAMEEAALEAGMTLSAWARKVLKGGLVK